MARYNTPQNPTLVDLQLLKAKPRIHLRCQVKTALHVRANLAHGLSPAIQLDLLARFIRPTVWETCVHQEPAVVTTHRYRSFIQVNTAAQALQRK